MDRRYLLWLATRLNGDNAMISRLIKTYGDAEEVYGTMDYSKVKSLKANSLKKLLNKDLSDIDKSISISERLGVKIMLVGDRAYPRLLRQIHCPPSVLYIKGALPSLDNILTIGVVGTRRISDYGIKRTREVTAQLTQKGAVIVTGLATGADSVGAWTALENGGTVIGVVGTGIDIIYPVENEELFEAVCKRGCIISQFPPNTPPTKTTFPVRNRIIAGLSRGVLITEAPKKSGALITANLALEENRDVFVIPGDTKKAANAGGNALIQDGARVVMSGEDILCEYPDLNGIKPKEPIKPSTPYIPMYKPEKSKGILKKDNQFKKQSPKEGTLNNKKETDVTDEDLNFKWQDISRLLDTLNDSEAQIAKLMTSGPQHIDAMARQTGIAVGDLNMRLVMMEMKGIVEKLPGGYYMIKID